MKQRKYCEHCGSLLIGEKTGKYDTETGEEIMRMVCPKSPCEHSGCSYTELLPVRSLLGRILGVELNHCHRCRAEQPDYYH
jgi:hypothetical protein